MGRAARGEAALAWKRRIDLQRRSPLSFAECCIQEEVSPASFHVYGDGGCEVGMPLGRRPLFMLAEPLSPPTMSADRRPPSVYN